MKIFVGCVVLFFAFPLLIGVFDIWAFTLLGHTVSFVAWTDATIGLTIVLSTLAFLIFSGAGAAGVWE
jgi:hypothetical protein